MKTAIFNIFSGNVGQCQNLFFFGEGGAGGGGWRVSGNFVKWLENFFVGEITFIIFEF